MTVIFHSLLFPPRHGLSTLHYFYYRRFFNILLLLYFMSMYLFCSSYVINTLFAHPLRVYIHLKPIST